MLDEDDTVKDLATKTIEELWFSSSSNSTQKPRTGGMPNHDDKGLLLSKVAVIMGTCAGFKERQTSPLEDMLHKIMSEKEGSESNLLHARYEEICEALIDGLVDASDLPGFASFITE